MGTNIELFNYDLPESFIAQRSVEPRDHSKLMVLSRFPSVTRRGVGGGPVAGQVEHRHFFDIPDLLKPGDVLVFNTSKVFKARLVEGGVEIFVLRITNDRIECLLKPGKKFPVGSRAKMHDRTFLTESKSNDGLVTMRTGLTAVEMMQLCDDHGQIPIPPYIKQKSSPPTMEGLGEARIDHYQTIYAKEVGSVAAPTAGFHFTDELLEKIKAKGVQIEYVVLHVGIGTFRPVQVDTLEEHKMHSEWVSVPADVATRINDAKREGRRIIAVGTTTTRVLEAVASLPSSFAVAQDKHGEARRGSHIASVHALQAYEGDVNMFITPGYEFKIIDGLITNFHLPKSTLLVLVSALAGREAILAAYEEAKKNHYRFFSFGDAMFIQ